MKDVTNNTNINTQLSIIDVERSLRENFLRGVNDTFDKIASSRVVQNVGSFIDSKRRLYFYLILITSIISLIVLPLTSTLVTKVVKNRR